MKGLISLRESDYIITRVRKLLPPAVFEDHVTHIEHEVNQIHKWSSWGDIPPDIGYQLRRINEMGCEMNVIKNVKTK